MYSFIHFSILFYVAGAMYCRQLMNGRIFDGRQLEAEVIDFNASSDVNVNVNDSNNSSSNVTMISKPATVTAVATTCTIVKRPEIKSSDLGKDNGKNDGGVNTDVTKIEQDTDDFLNSLL